MKLLLLVPKLTPYSASFGSDVSVVNMASGMPRRRRTQIGATHKASIEFTVTDVHFDYLMAFWRLTRAESFACRAIIKNSQMRWHSCQWITAPNITNHGGGVFSFACEISIDRLVKPKSPPELKFASHPYALLSTSEMSASHRMGESGAILTMPFDEMSAGHRMGETGVLRSTVNYSSVTDTQSSITSHHLGRSGLLRSIVNYSRITDTQSTTTSHRMGESGAMKLIVIYHQTIENQSISAGHRMGETGLLTEV